MIGEYISDWRSVLTKPFIEPELFQGYDPKKKIFNLEIELIQDLEPIEITKSEAEKFKYEHEEKCDALGWRG